MNEESEDHVVKEIDVYLAKSLASNIYVLQYPVRPSDKPYTDTTYLGARIKPKQNKLEIEIDLNTTNENYSRPKGEQFALNVDGKQTAPSNKQSTNNKEQRYYKSNYMDKQVLTSSNGTLGQMSRLYQLGVLKENKLHLNPIQSILQMKPSFEYFDIYEKKVKEVKEAQLNEMDYSTEEETEIDDKAELVTLKYSSSQSATNASQQQETEQNWIPLVYLNEKDSNSESLKEMLYCKNLTNQLKIDYSNEEFINRLIENCTSNNVKSEPKIA